MKVNILGQEYEIKTLTCEEYPKLAALSADGLAELYAKQLIIKADIPYDDEKTYANVGAYVNKVVRHEIMHAFFHEAGLHDNYCVDETLIDWLALQMPKIVKAMQEAKVL